jgi:fibronectin-binding autotransporter adhesin
MTYKSLSAAVCILVPCFVLLSEPVQSQTYLGNSSANWSDGANWVGGAPPNGTTALSFGGAPINSTSNNDISGLTVLGINFTNGSPLGFTNTPANTTRFVLNGEKIILGGDVIANATTHSGVPTGNILIQDIINFNMDMSSNRNFSAQLLGTNNLDRTQHDIIVNGSIGETGGSYRLLKSGGGTLFLNAPNTFTNGIQISGGTIQFQTPEALSTGVIRSSFGSFVFAGSSSATVSNSIDLYSPGTASVSLSASGSSFGSSNFTFSGALSASGGNGATKTISLQGNNTGNNLFATPIADFTQAPVGLQKSGTGRWVVADNNTFTGPVTITAGTLNVSNLNDNLSQPSSIGRNATINFAGGTLRYANTGNSTLVIANRAINLSSATVGGGIFSNDSQLINNTIVFNGGFTNTGGNATKALSLGGSNLGNNTFNSLIGDSTNGSRTGLTKTGAGNWRVTANNTFSGLTTISGGELRVPVIDDNLATPQPLGINGTVSFNGGVLSYNAGTSPIVMNNRTFRVTTSGGLISSSIPANTVTFNGPIVHAINTSQNNVTSTWRLGGTNPGANEFNSVISDGITLVTGPANYTRTTQLLKNGPGTWIVNGLNTYSGATSIDQGTLVVSSIGNKGDNSNIGNASSVALGEASIRFSGVTSPGTLRYIGPGETSNRLFVIGNSTAFSNNPASNIGGRIINDGTGSLNFTGENGFFNTSVNSIGNRTLTLGGNFAGVNAIQAAILNNAGLELRLIKEGSTTWALEATNWYQGNTTVNQGKLLINGSTSVASAVIVNSGGILGGSGIVGGNTTLNSGSVHSPGTSPGIQRFLNSLTYGANSTLEIDITSLSTDYRGFGFDGIDVNGVLSIDPSANSHLVFNGAEGFINFNESFWGVHQSWEIIAQTSGSYSGPVFGSVSNTADSLGNTQIPGTFAWRAANGSLFLDFAPIPEPTSWCLAILGIASVGLRRSRRVC